MSTRGVPVVPLRQPAPVWSAGGFVSAVDQWMAPPPADGAVVAEVVAPSREIPQGVKRIRKPDGSVWWYWAAHQFSTTPNAFKPRTALLWRGTGEPTAHELAEIWNACDRLTEQLHDWLCGPRRKHVRRGQVYFLEGPLGIKIGFSIAPERRRRGLQTGMPGELKLLGAVPGTIRLERRIQRQFRHLKVGREWYRDDPALRAFISMRCPASATNGPPGPRSEVTGSVP